MTLLTVSAARSLASREPLRQVVSLLCRRRKSLDPGATRAGPGLLRMAAVGAQHIHRHGGDARHRLFVALPVRWPGSSSCALLVPGRMPVVAEDQLGADARAPRRRPAPPACGTGRSGTARCLPGLRHHGIVRAARLQFEHVENLRSARPAASRARRPAGRSRPGAARGRACCRPRRSPSADGSASRATGCMAEASVQAPVPGRSEAMLRISAVHARNWARKSSEVMVTVNWRRCTASGPS